MKKLIYILAFNCLLLIPSTRDCYTQPSITWNRLYDGGFNDKDYGYGLCQTTDGNFVIGGTTRYHGSLALKINPYGDVIWLKDYSVTYGEAITATTDGGCLLVSPSFLKINSTGDSVWYHNYLNSPVTNLYDIIQCSEGGFIACGRAYYDSGYVMKTNLTGDFLWDKVVSWNIKTIVFYSVSEAFTDGYVVVGSSWGFNVPVRPAIVRLDSNGTIIWMKINQLNDSLGHAKRILRLPSYYLVGCGKGFFKVDDQGNILSYKIIPLDFNDEIRDMNVINNNRFIIVSTNEQNFIITSKLRLIDSSGNTLYSQALEFSDFVRLKKIQLAGNGDVVFSGDAARYDTSNSDLYAVRTDANLNFPPINIQNISGNIPNQFRLGQNFPNPFNPFTKITYELPVAVYVKLAVYDILGREIAVLVNKNQLAGKYVVGWNSLNYPSGIYFYTITAFSTQYQINSILDSETKKMILLK